MAKYKSVFSSCDLFASHVYHWHVFLRFMQERWTVRIAVRLLARAQSLLWLCYSVWIGGGSQTRCLIRDSVAFQPLHLITDLLHTLGMTKVTTLLFQYPLISQQTNNNHSQLHTFRAQGMDYFILFIIIFIYFIWYSLGVYLFLSNKPNKL